MNRQLKVPEHEKPRHLPPKKIRLPIVALAATLALSNAPLAGARPSARSADGPKPPQAADTDKPRSPEAGAPYEAVLGPAVGEVETTVTRTRGEGEGFLFIDYSDQSRRPRAGVSIPFSEERGGLVQVIQGRVRTVLIFENSIVVAVGYDAAFSGELLLRMAGENGEFRNSSAVEFPLPADCLSGNLLSAAVATGEDGSESVLYFMNRGGHVRAFSMDRWGEPYAGAQLSASEGARLVPIGRGLAALFEPGSPILALLKADFTSETILLNSLPVPPSDSIPAASASGPEIMLTIGGRRFLLSEQVPGDFHSLRLVALP